MFGYVRPYRPELRVREDEYYKGTYCGLCKAMGIKNVVEVNAFDTVTLEKVIKEEVAKDEVSVIITKSPCVLLKGNKFHLFAYVTKK